MPAKLVISIDYDDCLLRKYGADEILRTSEFDQVDFDLVVNQHRPPLNHNKWKDRLRVDNGSILAYISGLCQQKAYDEVVLCIGSNRQNPYTDITNACRNNLYSGSCFEGLDLFSQQLASAIGMPVKFDTRTTADYFNHRCMGDTVARARGWLDGSKPFCSEADAGAFFTSVPNDRTKISLHYLLMHEHAAYFDGNIDYLAVDDGYQREIRRTNPAIIDVLEYAYRENPDMIPHNTTMYTIPYKEGILNSEDIKQVTGIGVIDSAPFHTMRQMMVHSLDGETLREKQSLLNDHHSCDCWNLFNDSAKREAYQNALIRISAVSPLSTTQCHSIKTDAHSTEKTDSPEIEERLYEAALRRVNYLWAQMTKAGLNDLETLIRQVMLLKKSGKESTQELTTILNDTYAMLTGTMSYADYQSKAESAQGKPSSGLKHLGILMLLLGTIVATIGLVLVPTIAIAAAVTIIATGMTTTAVGVGFFAAGRRPTGLSEAMSNIANDRMIHDECRSSR